MNLKKLKKDEHRWEWCPHCKCGFPTYLGKDKDNQHHFECGGHECGAWFKVLDGEGQWDLKLGMELNAESIYYEKCDTCLKTGPVKVQNLRFVCHRCGGY